MNLDHPTIELQEFSLRTRAANLARMSEMKFDIAVIGGGVTGAGIALDAAARGLKVALIEMRDFASGTSSRSSKLIHGGLRYLKQMQFGLVRESLHERWILGNIAPHLCQPLPFLVPIYQRGIRSPLGASKLKLAAGLTLYDLLAGRRNIARHRWLPPSEVIDLAPTLRANGLRGGFRYFDCLTDDSRLVIEVIKTAAARGAVIANYAFARGLITRAGKVSGVEAEDTRTGKLISLSARVVINATSVWSDKITELTGNVPHRRTVRPSKGIHIIVPREKIGTRVAVLIPSIGEDRFLFVIPWHAQTLIGTTDSEYNGDLNEPVAEPEEVDHILRSAATYFPKPGLAASDVIGTFAGLRPLVAFNSGSTTDLSRKELIVEQPSGLISVIGGKLTTYRSIAERVTDLAQRRLQEHHQPSPHHVDTRHIVLSRGALSESEIDERVVSLGRDYGVPSSTIQHLMRCYGGNYKALLDILREGESMKSPLVEELPHIEAEVVYSIRHEMATTVSDFLARRTRIALLTRDGGRSCVMRVAEVMGKELAWSDAEIKAAATQ